jgi:hypothetical protein
MESGQRLLGRIDYSLFRFCELHDTHFNSQVNLRRTAHGIDVNEVFRAYIKGSLVEQRHNIRRCWLGSIGERQRRTAIRSIIGAADQRYFKYGSIREG